MIAVVDSGGANLTSVLFALERIGVRAELTRDPERIFAAPRVLLPGVGAAAAAMEALLQRELISCLRELKQPVLGICLGMQLLFERSEEGNVQCLGMMPGTVSRLRASPGLPVPHMGWNRVRAIAGGCPLIASESAARSNSDGAEGEYYYFVHSYAAPAGMAVRAVADYGGEVPAIVQQDNWFGAQFHPERSGLAGQRFLERFARL